MKNSHYLILVALVAITSCEEDRILGGMEATCRVKTMKDAAGNVLQAYTYDGQGRIIKWEVRSANLYSEYYYEANRVVELAYNADGTFDSLVYVLNTDGNVVRTEFKGYPGSYTFYEYDDEGYMIEQRNVNGQTNNTTTTNFFYKDHNCVLTAFFDPRFNGEIFYDSSWYEYDAQLINKSADAPDIYGKKSRNLVKSARTRRPDKTYYSEYHYILNENGYVIEGWVNDARTKVRYEYECQ